MQFSSEVDTPLRDSAGGQMLRRYAVIAHITASHLLKKCSWTLRPEIVLVAISIKAALKLDSAEA